MEPGIHREVPEGTGQSGGIPDCKTKRNPKVLHDFSAEFYKFPSYLRRAAIAETLGKVSSYRSNFANWEAADPEKRGEKPSMPQTGFIYPAMYRDNMFIRTGMYQAALKVYIRNTWDWVLVDLKRSDVDYISRHCQDYKECVPTLQKRGKKWYLDFVFQTSVSLPETDIYSTRILAVDLGINHACTCSVMTPEGTVIGREFLSLPKEYDSLEHAISHIKHAQRLCARKYVQSMVADKAHRNGIRIARVCARNTSRLAFDGTGRIKRGKETELPSYSLCRFTNGKQYNCDPNASYNIGARYYIRELLKTLPATAGQAVTAKVPELAHRSLCTLSSLIKLNAVLRRNAGNPLSSACMEEGQPWSPQDSNRTGNPAIGTLS